jgi:hypothetical protein
MLLTFSASGSRAGTVAREFALNNCGRHSDDYLFRHLQHRLRETVCNMMIVVHASRSLTARKLLTNEGVIIVVLGRELCTSLLDFARDVGLSELRTLELRLDCRLNPHHLSRNEPLFQDHLPPGHFYDN